MDNFFSKVYPNITKWVEEHGWIELGQDEYSSSFIRALNEGGMVWEGNNSYKNMDEALRHLEEDISEWLQEI